MSLFDDIKKAATTSSGSAVALPFQAYNDQKVFDEETKKIFHKDWVFVCNEFTISEPGDRFAFKLAGEPVVIIRGKDGTLRALSNTCTHRGTLLADDGFSKGKDTGSNLVCPYHSWNFTDEGKLRGAPMTGSVKIDKEKHCLPEFQLKVFYGMIFINLDPDAKPFEERFAGLERYFANYNPEQYNSGYEQETEFWAANWKLAIENAVESYHLFKVHKPTLEPITPTKGAYYVQGNAEWSVTGGEAKALELPWYVKMFVPADANRKGFYTLISMPPSLVGVAGADGMFGYISFLPDGPGRTVVRGGGVGRNLEFPSGMTKKFLDDFFAEDKFICERAYQGMSTKFSKGGQLVELERIVVDFHQYVSNRLFETPVDAPYTDVQGHKNVGVEVIETVDITDKEAAVEA